jgi:hypothetical protein
MRTTACHAAPCAAFGGLLAALLLGAPAAWAQDATRPVYRCPGPPVLYTDAITPEEARSRYTVPGGFQREIQPVEAWEPQPMPSASPEDEEAARAAVEAALKGKAGAEGEE